MHLSTLPLLLNEIKRKMGMANSLHLNALCMEADVLTPRQNHAYQSLVRNWLIPLRFSDLYCHCNP